MITDQQTIATRMTGSGRSAVAVIGLRGKNAASCVQDCFIPAFRSNVTSQPGDVRYGVWRGSKSSPGESIVLTPISDDCFEIHGHGGDAAVHAILRSLTDRGVQEVTPAKWHNDRSVIQTEADSILQHCVTNQQASIVLQQRRSGLESWSRKWIDEITNSDLNQEDAQPNSIANLQGLAIELKQEAAAIFERSAQGILLTQPRQIVLAGPPNVGKSSLMNQIVGYRRSITHDSAGTTRDVLQCDTVIAGVPVRLSDTAGIRQTDHLSDAAASIEREGIRRAALAVQSADILLIVCEPSNQQQLDEFQQSLSISNQTNVLRVLNKADLDGNAETTSNVDVRTIATSEEQGSGITELMNRMGTILKASLPPSDQPVPMTERQLHWINQLTRLPLDSPSQSISFAKRLLQGLLMEEAA
ncbi:GTPase [Rhodopirellula halodulae]|uniref:GTPase n=1 Tax=Rhodopirellula halodulae TaxID=2894198 RepID=UPI001E39702B|nr:GTPase [Rhodopirellula sp. JC737]MCC9657885.1 50S ribosome-binding GTPase [Rhodopirellula sp. JC737]